MYIRGKGEVFLLDRDNSVFACAVLTFPARSQGEHISDTLLDGVCGTQILLDMCGYPSVPPSRTGTCGG